jgi:hypothetical protein
VGIISVIEKLIEIDERLFGLKYVEKLKIDEWEMNHGILQGIVFIKFLQLKPFFLNEKRFYIQ